MLFYVGSVVSVLLGIDIAAQILGDGPNAYLGAPIGAAFFFLVYRFARFQGEPTDIFENQRDIAAGEMHPTPRAMPPEIAQKWAEQAPRSEAAPPPDRQARSRRPRRPQSRRASPPTLLERLKAIARAIDK